MITLTRTHENETCTIGNLKLGNFKCATLERPWEDNHSSVSRIPSGLYSIHRRYTGRFYGKYNARYGHEFVMELGEETAPRYAILIHIGNSAQDSRGCVLLGEYSNVKEDRISSSVAAYKAFYEECISESPHSILITEEFVKEAF